MDLDVSTSEEREEVSINLEITGDRYLGQRPA